MTALQRATWPLVFALSACAAPRLQTLGEAYNEVGKGNQQKLEARCPKDGVAAVDCKRKIREEFEDLRKKNSSDARS
ncbi:MAG: hypothetical protein JNL93_12510 [Pelomonas sp.]|nr:hypothetical protein [Roseateles sp.]